MTHDSKLFKSKKLFDENEVDELLKIILETPDNLFCQRFDGMKTLGAASYLDIKNQNSAKYWHSSGSDLKTYLSMANDYNPILRNLFSNVYQKLCNFFSSEFGVFCELHPNTAVPGFHIYENFCQFGAQQNHIPHFDGQYQDLMPIFHQIGSQIHDFNGKTLSFTIPISLPNTESGLKIWDLHLNQTRTEDKESLKEKFLQLKSQFIRYEEGVIVYHSGHMLHQIKSWLAEPEDKKRITLQGHGLFENDCLFLYW